MARVLSKNIYKQGDMIHPISNPDRKLIVKKFENRTYYCLDPKDASKTEFTFFEKEIIAAY